jgi:hypothetical protein
MDKAATARKERQVNGTDRLIGNSGGKGLVAAGKTSGEAP